MTDTTALAVPPPESAEDADHRLRAARHLDIAFRAAQLHPVVTVTAAGVTAVIHAEDSTVTVAGIAITPLNDEGANASMTALREHGVDARIDVEPLDQRVTRVTIVLDDDAVPALADLIVRRLYGPRAAAHRLRTALAAASITPHVAAVSSGRVEVGPLTVEDARALVALLHGRAARGRSLTHLATLVTTAMDRGARVRVAADPRPGCDTCARPDQIVIRPVTDISAEQLATAIKAAANTHLLSDRGPQ